MADQPDVDPLERQAAAYLFLATRFGWTPDQIDSIGAHLRLKMRDLAEAAAQDKSARGFMSINEARRSEGLEPHPIISVERGRRHEVDPPGDDGAAGLREPRNPTPTPLGPSTTTTTPGVVVTFTLSGDDLYRAITPVAQRYKQRTGRADLM